MQAPLWAGICPLPGLSLASLPRKSHAALGCLACRLPVFAQMPKIQLWMVRGFCPTGARGQGQAGGRGYPGHLFPCRRCLCRGSKCWGAQRPWVVLTGVYVGMCVCVCVCVPAWPHGGLKVTFLEGFYNGVWTLFGQFVHLQWFEAQTQ